MDRWRFGRAVRALRTRRGWTQARLGQGCGLSRTTISRIETGRVDRIAFGDIRAVAAALDARLELDLGWRGAALDRLIDERHASVVDATVRWLRSAGWDVAVEVSFAIFGERGSIDLLGRHPGGALLVIEVKASIGDVNQTLISLDRKRRLAPRIARDRGWQASRIGTLLVVAEGTTSRSRIARHGAAFQAGLPSPAAACRSWVRDPSGPPPRGIVFLASPDVHAGNSARARAGPGSRARG